MAEKRMTFLEHLDEFRQRLAKSLLALVICGIIGFYYAMEILELLKWRFPDFNLTYRGLMEPFMIKFKIGILAGLFMSSPIIFYQMLAFLAPALKGKEKRVLYPMVFLLVFLFLMGAGLGYYYIMPIGARWLLAQDEGKLIRLLNVSDFVNFTTLFLLAFGVAFETPLVLIILIKLGIVSRESLRKNWRIAYVTLLTISAISTPDWSLPPMLMLGASMIVLYELTLLLTRWL